jgi:hypothetical protein
MRLSIVVNDQIAPSESSHVMYFNCYITWCGLSSLDVDGSHEYYAFKIAWT